MANDSTDLLQMVFYKAPYNRHYTRGKRKRTLVVNISKEILSYNSEWRKLPTLVIFKQMVRRQAKTHGLRRDSKIPE